MSARSFTVIKVGVVRALGVGACVLLGSSSADAQLRVCTWNVTNYSSGRVAQFGEATFGEAIYGVFEGRSLAPDVLIEQEFLSSTGVTNFLNILNTAPGSPGDWAAAPFVNGNDTDNAFFYRTSRVDFLGGFVIVEGAGPPEQPRDTNRYDVRLKEYSSEAATISCYSSHMKAGSGSSDQARRLIQAERIRDDAELLPMGRALLLIDCKKNWVGCNF